MLGKDLIFKPFLIQRLMHELNFVSKFVMLIIARDDR